MKKIFPYIESFEKRAFGMFIHWGLYSEIGRGEWVYHMENMTPEAYKPLMDTFTAKDFDAEVIAKTAKAAGCRYITLTTRHHDGFSLFDTKGLSEFDVMHSPCGRDLIAEFCDACRKFDLLPMLYHTTLDWMHPDFNEDFEKYLEYLRKSVELLCTNYGKIGGIWFDGNWSKPDADWQEDKLYGMIRRLQPEAMIINNTGLNSRGKTGHPEIDSVTFEQGCPTNGNRHALDKYVAAEMCETMNDHWGIAVNDFNYKSPATMIEHLCLCRKAEANYLLNIGLCADGGFEPMQKEILLLIGRWTDLFGEALYNTKPYRADQGSEFILKGNDKLYIVCMQRGIAGDSNVTVTKAEDGSSVFEDIAEKIKSVRWMDNKESVAFTQEGETFTVQLVPQRYGSSFCVRIAEAEIE